LWSERNNPEWVATMENLSNEIKWKIITNPIKYRYKGLKEYFLQFQATTSMGQFQIWFALSINLVKNI